MNGHGSFVVTSLLFALITTLVGFAAHSAARLEASEYYVARIEECLGIPVSIVSVGPDRDQTILR
jgi:adenylosuccinate synthase